MQYWHGGRVALTYYGQENISLSLQTSCFMFLDSRQKRMLQPRFATSC